MTLEQNADQPRSSGFLARIKRAWARDSHLSLPRRLQKGAQVASQLVRARAALKDCDQVGAGARVAGRMRVENHGSIVIGDHLNINSSWVPTELVTGREGRIEIGDDVLINFGTMIAAGSTVAIGGGSMIGPHCIISDVDIPEMAAGANAAAAKPIEIGRDVWLAGRVTVRPGVKIGDGAVVVAGSIVESNVPAHVMASGIPARLLPKLGTVPRQGSEGRGPQAPQAAAGAAQLVEGRSAGATAPQLCGSLISDFTIDELANELGVAGMNPVLHAVVAPRGRLAQSLTAPPQADARDFAVVWTRPEAAVPSFARLVAGASVDACELDTEVDAFCAGIERSVTHYRYVFVPTWTQPSYRRSDGVFDGRPGGVLWALSAMNQRLIAALGRSANVFVLDAGRWHAAVGPSASNPRAWYLGHMAMARPVVAEAAQDLRAALAALAGRQRRLLVLGLEDMLWSDVLADSTTSADPVGEAYVDFQRELHSLSQRGVLLALLGAAEQSAVQEAMRNRAGMVLRETDFAGLALSASDEAANITSLAARLGVALDAVVYIDARSAARARARDALPSVYVPDWPEDKLLYPSSLYGLRCFDSAPATGQRGVAAR